VCIYSHSVASSVKTHRDILVISPTIVMSMSVCLSVSLYAHISQKPHGLTSPKYAAHVACGLD